MDPEEGAAPNVIGETRLSGLFIHVFPYPVFPIYVNTLFVYKLLAVWPKTISPALLVAMLTAVALVPTLTIPEAVGPEFPIFTLPPRSPLYRRLLVLLLLLLLVPPHVPAAFPTHPLNLLFSSNCNCLAAIPCIAWFGPAPVGAPASLNWGTVVPPLCANAFCFATISFRYRIWSPVVAPVVW